MSYKKWLATVAGLFGVTLVVFVLLVAFTQRVVTAPGYMREVMDPLTSVLDIPFSWKGLNCDVVVYGDSTTITGVDPRVITAGTGMSACNIASIRDVTDATGTFPLDRYLANNRRPRYIVFEYAPDFFFRRTDWDDIGAYAPFVLLLRQHATARAAWLMLVHPKSTLRFVLPTLRDHYQRKGELPRLHSIYDPVIAKYESSKGLFTTAEHPMNFCEEPPRPLFGKLDPRWAEDLRRQYAKSGTTVIVRTSAVPGCDPELETFRKDVAPLVDGGIPTLPIEDFVHGDRHFTLEGARLNTELLNRLLHARGAETHSSNAPVQQQNALQPSPNSVGDLQNDGSALHLQGEGQSVR